MVCPNCGTYMYLRDVTDDEEIYFCRQCGKRVSIPRPPKTFTKGLGPLRGGDEESEEA